MSRRLLTLAATALAVLLPVAPASAHVGTGGAVLPANATTTIDLSVPHGCGDAPTTALEVRVPDGFLVHDLRGPDGFLGEVVDHVATWRGGSLPSPTTGVFTLEVTTADVDGRVHLPTVQWCDTTELPWIDIGGDGVAEGQPAPSVVVTGGATVLQPATPAGAGPTGDDGHAAGSALPWLLALVAAVAPSAALLERRRRARDHAPLNLHRDH